MEKKRDSFFLADKKGKGKKQDRQQKNQKEEIKTKRFNQFNKNRVGVENGNNHEGKEDKKEKKPFDKKAYRLKKYSKKYKLEQWEEQRKKKLMWEYQKTLKKESMAGSYKPVSFDADDVDSTQEAGKFVRHPDLIDKENSIAQETQQKKDPFKRAKEHYNKIKVDKMQKQEEKQKKIEERKKKEQEYKKKKQEKFKKLSKKTKKGQPVMTGRLELLLEKIQKGK